MGAILSDNPFPAVHGRVCYRPCETGCNRAGLDSGVSIHAAERFLGDRAVTNSWGTPSKSAASGKRALVVGGGPSGLSAAYHLARTQAECCILETGRPASAGRSHG